MTVGGPTFIQVRDIIIIGAGPSGLGVAARLCEHMPAANFTDEEHRRFHWIKQYRASKASMKQRRKGKDVGLAEPVIPTPELDMLALDMAGTNWMQQWERMFKTFDISHLRSPMFFHLDPAERDALLSYAYANGRDDELRELYGCVGKELSKYQRKKREKQGRQPQNIPTIDERDRKDYYVPSTPLFFSHCRCIVDRYQLGGPMISQETVEDIRYGYVREHSDTEKIFSIKTNKGQGQQQQHHHAKIVVLAVGGNPPQIPCALAPAETEGATHAMHIRTFPPAYVREKMAPQKDQQQQQQQQTNILIVGGGLTSAQIADLSARHHHHDDGIINKTWLIARGPLKTKHFDIGLEWVGKFRNLEHARFWHAASAEERRDMIAAARDGGSVTPRYKKILDRHVAAGRVSVLTHTTIARKRWDPKARTWDVLLRTGKGKGKRGQEKEEKEEEEEEEEEKGDHLLALPPIDHIYFATGVGTDFESLPCLQSMFRDYPIESCGGFPCITEKMAWRDDVPLFVAGRFAALQLGPGAHNLIGARMGADRIAWSIQDMLGTEEGRDRNNWSQGKFNYLTGRGSRYDALADSSVAG